MKKKIFSGAAAVLAAAAIMTLCGLSASAEGYADPMNEVSEAAAVCQNEGTVFCASPSYDDPDAGYDIILTDTSSIPDSNSSVTVSSEKEEKNWGKIIGIAVIISAVVTGLVVYFTFRGYKYNGMTEPYKFKEKAPLELTDSEDVLIDVHVTSVHINRNRS